MSSPAVAVFIADNGSGPQLWRTDGTAGGTFVLAPIAPGPLTSVDGIAYFNVPDGSGQFGAQYQLWRTDGTAAGTYALALTPINPGLPAPIEPLGGQIYYIGTDATHREALFATDGVSAGRFVGNLSTQQNSTFIATFLGTVGNDLLIQASNAIWVSDGTAEGTHVLSDGEAGSQLQFASTPVSLNGKAYFVADDGVHGARLWQTDGTAATMVAPFANVLLGDVIAVNNFLVFESSAGLQAWDGVSATATRIAGTPTQSNDATYFLDGGKLYFESFDVVNTNSATAVFVTDGTLAGTHELASGSFGHFAPIGSRLVATGTAQSGTGLYVSDGTPADTTLVAADPSFGALVKAGSLVFAASSTGLWVSDGTVAGTSLLEAFTSISNLVAVGSEVVFSATTASDRSNVEPWVSDGTVAGTHQVAQLHAGDPGVLTVTAEANFGNDLAFVASTTTTGAQLWVSDGTAVGTTTAPGQSNPPIYVVNSPLVFAGGKLYFDSGTINGTQLWVDASPTSAPGPIAADLDFNAIPTFLTALGGKLYFYDATLGPQAFQRFGGPGLFVTDGTDAGTALVSGVTVLAQPVALGAKLVFVGNSAANGTGVFASDGTSAGTVFLAPASSDGAFALSVVSGAKAFFTDTNPATGSELWVTDGTAAGTHIVSDIAPGVFGSNPQLLTAFAGGVVFNASDSTHGSQVWFSNGTGAGTFQLAINQISDPSASLTVSAAASFNGKALFVANDGVHGDQLWSSDGTAAGTAVVGQLTLPDPGENATFFAPLNNKLFVVDSGVPWISDGTAAGTSQIQVAGGFSQVASTPILLDGSIYFTGSISGLANPDLFVSDGTSAGTVDIATRVAGMFSGGDDLFFFSVDGTHGPGIFSYNVLTKTETFLTSAGGGLDPEFGPDGFAVKVGGQVLVGTAPNFLKQQLWITDGTAAGTFEVLQAQAGSAGFTDFTSLGGKLYFASYGAGAGLWVTDGTVAGTHEILQIAIQNQTLAVVGGQLAFVATDASNVTSGWFYNPATGIAAPVPVNGVDSTPADFTPVGSGAFFVADDATSMSELWRLNSAGQSVELTSPTNGEVQRSFSDPISLAVSGTNLFFSGDDAVHGQGLFITDGASVTFLAQVSDPTNFSVIGGKLYFQGSDTTNGAEFWVSDGTAAGTRRLTDTQAPGNANASGFVAVGSHAFFSANDGVHGQELWSFNGQAGGAAMVTDLDPGAAGSNPTSLTAMGGALYFIASNGAGAELWRSDGTAAGTSAVTTASNGASPQSLTAVGAELFFFGSDSAQGAGLFVSNGTAGGTSFLHAFASIDNVTVQGGRLYFRGGVAGGSELWTSDGTAAGTVMLTSTGHNPGANPNSFTAVGDTTGLTQAFTNVLRGAPNSAFAANPTILLGDGTRVPNPMYQDAQILPSLVTLVVAGNESLTTALNTIEHWGDATTAVSGIAYQFFTGLTPGSAGYDYLINSPANPNNLNTAYYAKFSLENRFINFAVNLGKLGEGAAAFNAAYGALTLSQAVTKAYAEIFGFAPAAGKIDAILNQSVQTGGTRADYFAFYGGDGLTGLGTKAAAVGWLMVEADKADLGPYVASDDNFLAALATGNPQYNINLLTTYPTMTAAQAAAMQAQAVLGASITNPLHVADLAANVVANLEALQAIAASSKLASIMLSDATTPTLHLTATLVSSDAAAIAAISSAYAIAVAGTSAQATGETIRHFSTAGSSLDLTDLNHGPPSFTANFAENAAATQGTLTLNDGTHAVSVTLIGQFAPAGFSGAATNVGFTFGADSASGTMIGWHG